MLVTVWLTLTVLLCWGQITTSTNQESLILEAPTDQTVPVNSTATFSCRVTGFLVWEFDELEITSMRQDGFCSVRGVCVNGTLDDSPDETESVLLVAAIEENNGSIIRCLASETDISTPEESDIVILKIFDRPEPPTNLIFSPVSHLHLNLSWDAPIIFPGTEINYTVTVRNINTNERIQREGLNVTHCIFNGIEGSSVCDMYQFNVVAVNSAGRSDHHQVIRHSLPSLPNITGSVTSLSHNVVFRNGRASIDVSFEAAETCQDYPLTNYTIALQNGSTDGMRILGPYDAHGSEQIEIRLNSTDGIAENAQYNFSIIASNSFGNRSSNKTECFTTDVQSASVSQTDSDEDGVIVTCHFAEGSQALGCHVEFQIQSSIDNISMNISKNETASGVVKLAYPLPCYDICAFDWESDGTRGEVCVPVRVDQTSNRVNCGDPEPLTPTSQLIIGAAIGGVAGFLLLLIVVVIAILLVSYRCMQARKVRDKTNDYGDGGYGKYRNTKVNTQGVKVEEVSNNYHPPTTERSDSQATTDTILPPIYDAVQNYPKQGDQDSGETDYSGLSRNSQLSPTPRVEFTHDPQYSALNQAPTYAVLESNSIPLGILPGNREAYCEIDDVTVSRTSPINHESTAVSMPVSDTGMVPENEKLYCEIPSAGTTVY